MKLFAEIAKTEEQDDGTIKVWGWASTGAVDSDGEVVTPEAMKAALPDYMKFGAVREMHQPKAAGTAIEASVDDEGKTWFGAHVVDSEAVKKVKANVYKGFSIGGKVTDRDQMNKSIIKGIKLVEVSLVDRPANPEAVITVMKAERTPEDAVTELAEMLNAGKVSPERLIELAKADIVAPATATSEIASAPAQEQGQAPERAQPDTVEKSMWTAKSLLDALMCLRECCASADYEASAGEHTEALATEMRATLKALAEVCQKYLNEEMAMLMGDKQAAASSDDLAKLADATEQIAKLEGELGAAKAEVERLQNLPAPGKALLKAIAVGKSEDSNITETATKEDPALTLKGEALALHQLKSMYRAVAR